VRHPSVTSDLHQAQISDRAQHNWRGPSSPDRTEALSINTRKLFYRSASVLGRPRRTGPSISFVRASETTRSDWRGCVC